MSQVISKTISASCAATTRSTISSSSFLAQNRHSERARPLLSALSDHRKNDVAKLTKKHVAKYRRTERLMPAPTEPFVGLSLATFTEVRPAHHSHELRRLGFVLVNIPAIPNRPISTRATRWRNGRPKSPQMHSANPILIPGDRSHASIDWRRAKSASAFGCSRRLNADQMLAAFRPRQQLQVIFFRHGRGIGHPSLALR